MMIGGFLVGYGTRVSSGCISGLGICYISRLSEHLIFAICSYVAVAVITVFVRHLTQGASYPRLSHLCSALSLVVGYP